MANTKRALLTSALAIVACVAMLVGSTFAWFTDTASTGVNKIQAGNLKIELQMKDNDGKWVNAEGKTLPFLVEGKIPTEGTQILWEPGCTYFVPQIRVLNKGNLAVKFEYIPEALGVTGKLAEVLEPVFDAPEEDIECDVLKPGEASPAWSFGYHMIEEAGNEYQGATATGVCVTVVATQATYEHDSFDDQYDKDAPLDFVPVASADDLKAAAAEGNNVMLTDDVALTEGITFAAPVTIDLNGKTLASSLDAGGYSLVTKGAATIKNGTYKGTGTARGIGAYGDLTMDNVTVDVAGLVGVACSTANSTYTITNSTIKGGYALCNFVDNATINVSDCVLEGSGVGIYHNGSNAGLKLTVARTKINIGSNATDTTGVYISGSTATRDKGGYQQAVFTDCSITGNAAVEVKYTDLTLNNCTAVATVSAANASYVQNNNGATTNGFAVVSTDNTTGNKTPKPEGTITINGGSYTGLIGLHSLPGINENFPGFADTTYVIK